MDPLSPLPERTTDQAASARRKRRAMALGQKACNPCRLRKVKCSYEQPCRTCIEREHPEMCTYQSPSKRAPLELEDDTVDPPEGEASSAWYPSRADWNKLTAQVARVEQSLEAIHREISQAGVRSRTRSPSIRLHGGDAAPEGVPEGMHTMNLLTGETMYLGGNSVPAMVVALGKTGESDTIQGLLDRSILPIFALENESTMYPFVDLWGLPHASIERIERLCGLLPSNPDTLEFFRHYRDSAHVLYPGIVNIRRFESEIMNFLAARAAHQAGGGGTAPTEKDVYGKSLHWLGLLFACLASGCQCSSLPRKERQLTSQVFVCCAYECLRIINYLSRAQLLDIQNLLVIGNVLSNNMNAGVAWTLLGLTIRLSQGLGLHQECPKGTPKEERHEREEVWSRVIWQDSLLSITYDRASATAVISHHRPQQPPSPEGLTYADCMLQLCTIALDVVNSRASPQNSQRGLQRVEKQLQELVDIEIQAAPHLRDAVNCMSVRDHLEHWNWRLHHAYVISELCRPGLRRGEAEPSSLQSLRMRCVRALVDTVDAFLGLQNVTSIARLSWAAVHRALSSALLLGILKEPAREPQVCALLDRLVAVISAPDLAADSAELPGPIARAVAALTWLNSSEDRLKGSWRTVMSAIDTQIDNQLGSGGISNWSTPTTSNEGGSPHAQMQQILWGSSNM